jgi:riboflavin biosynthesis pyrimidine reductase
MDKALTQKIIDRLAASKNPAILAHIRPDGDAFGSLLGLGHTLKERGQNPSLYVEGGPTLASAFIEAGLADRFFIFLAPVLLGGQKLAVTDIGVSTLSERIDLIVDSTEFLGDDILITARPSSVPQHQHRKEA